MTLRIEDFTDGESCTIENLNFRTTHLFMEVAFTENLVYKKPSSVGRKDFHRFVELAEHDSEIIRPLESIEKSSNREELSSKYPSISCLKSACEDSSLRWLLIHKLQYDRVFKNEIISIPQSRFVLMNTKKLFGMRQTPSIIQEIIHGTSVWDMRDHENGGWKSKWIVDLELIGMNLIDLLESPLRNHINWNIKNFIYSDIDDKLYYVDCTPSVIFARGENEQNIKCILRDFS